MRGRHIIRLEESRVVKGEALSVLVRDVDLVGSTTTLSLDEERGEFIGLDWR